MIIIRVVLVAAAIMFGGCASQQQFVQSFDPAVLEAHVSTLASIDRWKIRGRLGVRTDKGGQIGRMVWVRQGAEHQIDIYGSLGAGHMRITVHPGEAVLVDSEGQVLTGLTAQAVLDQYIGWHFPVAELESWILGTAYPDSPAEQQWDEAGRIMSIKQAGWRVSLSKYGEFDSYPLPTHFRLTATDELQTTMAAERPDQPQPSQIRLVINSWTVY